ncbi:hypothetical protein BGW38_002537 [Lunasporangiospora selenospora]|uniref:U3-containing 90S pre-ribosomal complex subunit-domain containing protein n=1 Tax=Lunasporangiospora selenospora TaxID=979761 RepID=A0A9P6KJ66_9FUNG|nr:hypothetical protein BGW38_002537 [Lunasporangiospora selenospora]
MSTKPKGSGDALEDDFQLSDTEYLSDGADAGERIGESDQDNGPAAAGSKRKATQQPQKNKNKNQRKKTKQEEDNTPVGKRPRAAQIEALNSSQEQALKNLSSLEVEERRIPEAAVKDVSPFALDHILVHLESFLKFAVASWKSKLLIKDANAKAPANEHHSMNKKGKDKEPKKDKNKKPLETSSDLPKGSPVVLIVASSGVRAVDVIRGLPLFAEASKVGKLFAKHLKIEEQAYFLENYCTHICVGTPNRIEKLVSDGSLKLDRLELIVLDCHKDAKRRTILDIQEIRVDLFSMLDSEAIKERFASGHTQLALF